MADEQQAPKTEAAVPTVPAQWPGAFGAYKHSKKVVMTNIWTLVVLWIIVAVVDGVFQSVFKNAGGLVSFLVNTLAAVSYVLIYMAGVRGEKVELGDIISKSLSYWLKMIGLAIIVGVSIVVSLILFIIPFFFIMPRLVLSHYFLVDKDMDIMEAYKASWEATRGNVGKVWGIIGASIAMVLLSITIIGIPFSIYFMIMYSGAFAVLYAYLNKTAPAAAAAPAAQAPEAPAAS
jgi:uncharacterized membrane protein